MVRLIGLVLAMLIAGTMAAAAKTACHAAKPTHATDYWAWRQIDGRQCWYAGPKGKGNGGRRRSLSPPRPSRPRLRPSRCRCWPMMTKTRSCRRASGPTSTSCRPRSMTAGRRSRKPTAAGARAAAAALREIAAFIAGDAVQRGHPSARGVTERDRLILLFWRVGLYAEDIATLTGLSEPRVFYELNRILREVAAPLPPWGNDDGTAS
jgi:hypothetical protein